MPRRISELFNSPVKAKTAPAPAARPGKAKKGDEFSTGKGKALRIKALTAGATVGVKERLPAAALKDAFEQGQALGFAAASRGEELPVLPKLANAKLEAERARGLERGWSAGLAQQEQVCVEEGRKAGRGEQPALEGPSDLDTPLHRAQWAAYSRGVSLGQAELAAVVDGRAAANRGADRGGPALTGDRATDAACVEGYEAGYRQGLEDQYQVSLDAGRRATLGEFPVQENPDGLDLEVQRSQWAGYQRGVELGQAELAGVEEGRAAATEGLELPAPSGADSELAAARQAGLERGYALGLAARLPPGAEQAIGFALDPPVNRQNVDGVGKGWAYWCLGLMTDAQGAAGNSEAVARLRQPDAAAAYRVYAAQDRVQTEGVPPRGALVFFEWGAQGHIGLSLGDGTYVGTSTNGYTEVRPYTQGGSKYLGWANP